jgi:repressor LexA
MFLTEKQSAILNFIREFIEDKRISPTLEEMSQYFGVSKITIYEHVKALQEKGAIRKQANKKRSIELVEDASRPGIADVTPLAAAGVLHIRGRVAAGEFIEEVEDDQTFSLEDLTADLHSCYMLRVDGNSMIDDHICSGDLVIVQPARSAENGQIVVARVDDALTGGKKGTIKRFYRERNKVRLQPANAELEPMILPAADVEVEGTVVGVVRGRV